MFFSRVLLCSFYGVVGGCQGVAKVYWVVVAMVLSVIAKCCYKADRVMWVVFRVLLCSCYGVVGGWLSGCCYGLLGSGCYGVAGDCQGVAIRLIG